MRFILAVSDNGKIAKNGKIPWNIPHDLQWFKMNTYGTNIVMGRKTWESMGKRKLKGRKTYVLSRNAIEGVNTIVDISEVKKMKNTWVIGGANVCEQLWSRGDILMLTRVHKKVSGGLRIKLPKMWELWGTSFGDYTFSMNVIQ